jgi:hypothetical protein
MTTGLSEFAAIEQLVGELPPDRRAFERPTSIENIAVDLQHYLVIAYSEMQLRLDTIAIHDWAWREWLSKHHAQLIAALSWNYDLVLERVLEDTGIPFHYAGLTAGVSGDRLLDASRGIPLTKPHGSVNFAPDGVRMAFVDHDGEEPGPATYPRDGIAIMFDGPMRTLNDRELISVRDVADIVLPGEWNHFQRDIHWINTAYSKFRHAIEKATDLLVVGFSMAPCDAREFADALSWAQKLERIVVADPSPSESLLSFLRTKTPEVIVWRGGPQDL